MALITAFSAVSCAQPREISTPTSNVETKPATSPSISIFSASPATPTLTFQAPPPAITPATPLISPQPGSIVGGPFLPGEVLAGLPVYPGAAGTTSINTGLGPQPLPFEVPTYRAKSPGYQSASAQYSVQAAQSDIIGWYLSQMAAKGYRHSGDDSSANGGRTEYSMIFFSPSQPLISVQVHIYSTTTYFYSAIFELQVVYLVPLPKPPEEILPGDVDSIKIDYYPGSANELVKTITDGPSIKRLVDMVNRLTPRPDNPYIGPFSEQTLFRSIFHSPSKGDITVTDTIYSPQSGIHVGSSPPMEDIHGLLLEAVQQILGVPNAAK